VGIDVRTLWIEEPRAWESTQSVMDPSMRSLKAAGRLITFIDSFFLLLPPLFFFFCPDCDIVSIYLNSVKN